MNSDNNKPEVPPEIIQWINDNLIYRMQNYDGYTNSENNGSYRGAIAMYHKMQKEIELIKATHPDLDKEQDRLERVCDEFIKNWQPGQTNSHLGQTLQGKFNALINEANEYKIALNDVISCTPSLNARDDFHVVRYRAAKVLSKYKPSI